MSLRCAGLPVALALLLCVPLSARAIPPDAEVRDIEVRADGSTAFLYDLVVDGTRRIGYSVRSDPADPSTESPVALVPAVGEPGAEMNAGLRWSGSARFVAGAVQLGDEVAGLLFDTRTPGARPVVLPVSAASEVLPDAPGIVRADFIALTGVSDDGRGVGSAIGLTLGGPVGEGIRADVDGRLSRFDLPQFQPPAERGPLRALFFPQRITGDGGAVIGDVRDASQDAAFVDARGAVELVSAPDRVDAIFPSLVAEGAARERGAIVATGVEFASRASGILRYESATAIPVFHGLGDFVRLTVRDGTRDVAAFIANSQRSDPARDGFIDEVYLLEVGSPADPPCRSGESAGAFLGFPLHRVPGGSVFASGGPGFAFCVPSSTPGPPLRGRDLLRELAAIPESGFSAESVLASCFLGGSGAGAAILCEGFADASMEVRIRFVDRARLLSGRSGAGAAGP